MKARCGTMPAQLSKSGLDPADSRGRRLFLLDLEDAHFSRTGDVRTAANFLAEIGLGGLVPDEIDLDLVSQSGIFIFKQTDRAAPFRLIDIQNLGMDGQILVNPFIDDVSRFL